MADLNIRNISDVKKMIIEEFRTNCDKINFQTENKDVLDGIARTYMYYAKKFPEKIDPEKISGGDRIPKYLYKVKAGDVIEIKEKKSKPTNMADLYLYRLLLNMKTISEYKEEHIKGQVCNGVLILNRESMNEQLKCWPLDNLLKGKEDVVKNNLNSKVILHELSHMSAIPDAFGDAGFYGGSHKKDVQTYASRFEEICAEATALNVTGQKIPLQKKYVQGNESAVISGYNPESSNFAISSFIELAPFAFGSKELQMGRMMDPLGYMEDLNVKHAKYANEGGTFAGRIQQDFKDITDNGKLDKLVNLQADFIEIGMQRILSEEYSDTCTASKFKQDMGCMLRIKPLLYRSYKDDQNIQTYEYAMSKLKEKFDTLKSQKGMFQNYESFDDFIDEGLLSIQNSQRKSLGLEPIRSIK